MDNIAQNRRRRIMTINVMRYFENFVLGGTGMNSGLWVSLTIHALTKILDNEVPAWSPVELGGTSDCLATSLVLLCLGGIGSMIRPNGLSSLC